MVRSASGKEIPCDPGYENFIPDKDGPVLYVTTGGECLHGWPDDYGRIWGFTAHFDKEQANGQNC